MCSDSIGSFNFGSKLGKVEVNTNQKGADLESLKKKGIDENIFKLFDTNGDNVLDSTELAKMWQSIGDAAGGNERLGKKEAKKLLGDNYKGNDARADLKAFLDAVNADEDDITSAVRDDNGNLVVTHKENENGVKTETFNDKKLNYQIPLSKVMIH
ncbi:hypothetical protein IJ818_01425 [bacterium]|nr:hypothetical protein [bacterium]